MIPINLQINKIDTVFFDFDGVLVDSVPVKTKAYQEIFSPYGAKAVDLITQYHAENGGIDRYKKIEYVLKQLNLDLSVIDEMALKFSDLVKNLVIKADSIPGMFELLNKLYNDNIPLYIVSGTPEEELRYIVDKRSWSKYFKGIYGSPMTKVDIVDMILQKNNYSSRRSVFIGDAVTDYKTALTHNLWYVGVPVN